MDLDKVNSLKEKGNKAFGEQKYDDAIGFYKDALKFAGSGDSNIAAILHSNIAQTYLQKKDYSLAVESATESLKLDPLFTKSNLHRANANVELENLADAMTDLRLIFLHEPNSKAAKDLMRRCSDKPKMKLEWHDLYAKCYMSQVLKKFGAQGMNSQNKLLSIWFQNALLRQSFLSMRGLDIANNFFCDTFVVFILDQGAFISFFGWIARQIMWLKYTRTSTNIIVSRTLFKLLYRLLRPGTFSLDIYCQDLMCDETLLLHKYSDVYLFKEGLLDITTVDENELKVMNHYSNELTRLLYHPGLSNFKNKKFPKAKALSFNKRHPVTNEFLKLWKKNEWPIESVSFVYGIPNYQSFKQFNGVVSSKVSNVFIQFAEKNHAFNKVFYNEVCSNLSTLKNVFPNLCNVTIKHRFSVEALMFTQFVQDMQMIREAYETIATKPQWCSKLNVVIFLNFLADKDTKSSVVDMKLLEQSVESLRQKHPDMQVRLCGPKSYDNWWSNTSCVRAVIEFENEVAQFEVAFIAFISTMPWNNSML